MRSNYFGCSLSFTLMGFPKKSLGKLGKTQLASHVRTGQHHIKSTGFIRMFLDGIHTTSERLSRCFHLSL